MAIQYSTTLRNAKLDQIEITPGTAALLKLFTGTVPATPATADSGTTLAIMTLPSDWMAAASGGTKAKQNTWQISAVGTGTIGYFRIYDSVSSACHIQGTCGQGSGDMSFDNSSVNTGQIITVNTFTVTAGNS
jgi:hypothetical protein